jgi:hypothetical protein
MSRLFHRIWSAPSHKWRSRYWRGDIAPAQIVIVTQLFHGEAREEFVLIDVPDFARSNYTDPVGKIGSARDEGNSDGGRRGNPLEKNERIRLGWLKRNGVRAAPSGARTSHLTGGNLIEVSQKVMASESDDQEKA